MADYKHLAIYYGVFFLFLFTFFFFFFKPFLVLTNLYIFGLDTINKSSNIKI